MKEKTLDEKVSDDISVARGEGCSAITESQQAWVSELVRLAGEYRRACQHGGDDEQVFSALGKLDELRRHAYNNGVDP